MENQIIDQAVTQLNRQTRLGFIYDIECTGQDGATDGYLRLPDNQTELAILCIKWLNNTTFHRRTTNNKIIGLVTEKPFIIITDYVNPNMAQRLRADNIQFLDTVGNAYIKQLPVYIDIQGKRKARQAEETVRVMQMGKAFQPKGMKVVFALLTQPGLISTPLRKIAEAAEVALGTVKQVVDDLIYQGYVVRKGKKGKAIVDINALQEKWLEAYPVNVEAKMNPVLFTIDEPGRIKALNLTQYQALYGGEVAAERYDHYLSAKDVLIYIPPQDLKNLIVDARLRKAKPHDHDAVKVILAEPLLALHKITGPDPQLAHPLLVYANLMASNDTRNHEAAARLYAKYLD